MLNDFRYALRGLRQNPLYAAMAILTLALGIGATTSLFTVVNAVLLRPLPYPEPDRIVAIGEAGEHTRGVVASEPNIVAWRGTHTLSQIAAYGSTGGVLTGAGEPVSLRGYSANASLFSVLQTGPAIGRIFTAAEEKEGADQVVVLSDALWRSRFHADPAVLGHDLTLSDHPFRIVGVMPAGFDFPRGAQYWRPRAFAGSTDGSVYYAEVIGRLGPRVTIDAARTELLALVRQADAARPANERGAQVAVQSLHDQMVGDAGHALWLLLAAVGALLLIACANVANLQLARAIQREREFAVRIALGADRWRLARLILLECLVVAVISGALGLAMPFWSVAALLHLSPESVPHTGTVQVDGMVLAAAAAIAVLSGILFALAPMTLTFRRELTGSITASGVRGGTTRSRQRLQAALVVGEIAIALTLVTGGGLITRSLARVLAVDPGFTSDHLLTAEVHLRRGRYGDEAQAMEFFKQATEALESVPGVQSVAVTDVLPLGGFAMTTTMPRPGDGVPLPSLAVSTVSRRYFPTMGIPLLSGRGFDATDVKGSATAVVLSITAARALFPSGTTLGARMPVPGSPSLSGVVVGVARDVPQLGLETAPMGQVYLSLEQLDGYPHAIAMRTSGDPILLERQLRAALHGIDPLQPVDDIRTMDDVVAESVAPRRFNSILIDTFAGLALFLASIGLYGVLAYQVAQRTREVGIRMALGAGAGSILALVLKRGAVLALAGIGLGLIFSFVAARSVASLLYQVGTHDPIAFVGAPLLLAIVALAASLVPARRAVRVQPVEALRSE